MRRNIEICKKCENYLMKKNEDGIVTSEMCLAMPRMLEILSAVFAGADVSAVEISRNETRIPFEAREVPLKCGFYAEHFIEECNK